MKFSISPWVFVLAAGLGSFGASWALGYGWPIAVIWAATGGFLGLRASRRLAIPPGLNDPNEPPPGPGSTRAGEVGCADEKSEENKGSQLSKVTRPLKPYQKFAFLAFLAQATICFILIVIGWLATKVGWSGSAINPVFVKDISYWLFPVEAGNTQAQALLNFLFVPPIAFYAVSMTGFIAAVFRSAGALMSDIKSNWRLLLLIAGIIVLVLIVLYPTDSYQTSSGVKRQILDGDLFTYIAFFCFMPLLGMMLSHALPEEGPAKSSNRGV